MQILLAGLYGGSSGIEAYTRILGEELRRVDHGVVTVDRSSGGIAEPPQGATFARLQQRSGRFAPLARPLADGCARRAIAQIAERAGADVIHATHLELAPRSRARLVVTAWDPEPTVRRRVRAARQRGLQRLPEARYAMIDRAACRRADAVIAVTHAVERSLSGRVPRVVWVPPFLPDERIEEPLDSRSLDCVMVANPIDSPRKGLDLAVEAVRHARESLRAMRLVLVGGWREPRRMQTVPDFCDVRGLLPPSEVRAVLRGAGCCIVPSRWEEFGYAALEALAAGTPVVCGPLPGLAALRTSGVLVARSREAIVFAQRLLAAVALDGFDYPSEACASRAVPRILEVYSGDTRVKGR